MPLPAVAIWWSTARRFAESFGATGPRITSSTDLRDTLERALATSGPVVIDVPIDYSDNLAFGATLRDDAFH